MRVFFEIQQNGARLLGQVRVAMRQDGVGGDSDRIGEGRRVLGYSRK